MLVLRLPRLALPHRVLSQPAIAGAAIALSSASAIAFGFVGVGRGGGSPFGNDGRFLHVAGAMWLRGLSPYDSHAFDSAARLLGVPAIGPFGFAYPPTVAPLAMLLGSLHSRASDVFLGALNVAAALSIASLLWRLLPFSPLRRARRDVAAFAAVAVLGSPFAAHVLWMGQTTLLSLAALLGGWHLGVVRGRVVLGGMLLATSTLKPQIVALPLAWLLLERSWRLAFAVGATGSLLSVPAALASGGPLAMARDWGHALASYASGPVQSVSFEHVFGLRSLLLSFGVAGGASAAVVVSASALGGLVLLWRGRERAGDLGVLAVTLSLSLLFVYAHDYDLAALAPLLLFAWVETEERPLAASALVLATALLFVPQRLLRAAKAGGAHAGHAASHASCSWALHWREMVVLAIVAPILIRIARLPVATGALKTAEAPGRF